MIIAITEEFPFDNGFSATISLESTESFYIITIQSQNKT